MARARNIPSDSGNGDKDEGEPAMARVARALQGDSSNGDNMRVSSGTSSKKQPRC